MPELNPEPDVAPEPEPVPHVPEPGEPQRLQQSGSGVPDEPAPPITVPERDEAFIWAFTGHEAGRAAYHAAGLLKAENPERRIILVDAEGHISQEILSTAVISPDDYIFGGLQGPVDHYLATHPLVGLSVLFCADPHAPGRGLVRHLRGHCDVVIVPCADTPYGREWLIGADRVVAAATKTEDLDEALTQAERLRGTNGTILAPMMDAGGASSPEEFPGGLTSHPIFSLPEPTRRGVHPGRGGTRFRQRVGALRGRRLPAALRHPAGGYRSAPGRATDDHSTHERRRKLMADWITESQPDEERTEHLKRVRSSLDEDDTVSGRSPGVPTRERGRRREPLCPGRIIRQRAVGGAKRGPPEARCHRRGRRARDPRDVISSSA